MRDSTTLLATGVVLATICGTACREGDRPSAESGLVVHGKGGMVRLDGRIPEGFPVSLFPDSKPTAVVEPKGAVSGEHLVRLETTGEALEVIRFYEADLRDRGYLVEREDATADAVPAIMLHGTGESGTVDVKVRHRTDGGRGAVVRVTWTQTGRP